MKLNKRLIKIKQRVLQLLRIIFNPRLLVLITIAFFLADYILFKLLGDNFGEKSVFLLTIYAAFQIYIVIGATGLLVSWVKKKKVYKPIILLLVLTVIAYVISNKVEVLNSRLFDELTAYFVFVLFLSTMVLIVSKAIKPFNLKKFKQSFSQMFSKQNIIKNRKIIGFSLVLVLLVFMKILLGQTCLHKNLSKEFNFEIKKINISKNVDIDDYLVKIIVYNKISNKKQEINFKTMFIFEDTFINCKTVRSYSTEINKNAKIINSDYGDLVIADFNFDNREDFAIKIDMGGYGGPLYNFYIQDNNKKFTLDKFLTTEVRRFPDEFIAKSKKLILDSLANNYSRHIETFEYNVKIKKWKLKESTYVNLD